MKTEILVAIATGVPSFVVGFGIGYVAHICKTMPTRYIAPDENQIIQQMIELGPFRGEKLEALKKQLADSKRDGKKPPYCTVKGDTIYVNDEPVATMKDADTAKEMADQMNALPR
jgi:hypothetical protein